jgi:hypothetical protein
MNCYCNSESEFKVPSHIYDPKPYPYCHPLEDYRTLKKGEKGMSYDFRKCPKRLNYIFEILQNEFKYYDDIQRGITQTKRIQKLKYIITKTYKLTEEDFNSILSKIIQEPNNVITTKHRDECETKECHSIKHDKHKFCKTCLKKRINQRKERILKREKYLKRAQQYKINMETSTREEEYNTPPQSHTPPQSPTSMSRDDEEVLLGPIKNILTDIHKKDQFALVSVIKDLPPKDVFALISGCLVVGLMSNVFK